MNILWLDVEQKQIVPYNVQDHSKKVYKFLYWQFDDEEVLLAGPQRLNHLDLVEECCALDSAKKSLSENDPNGAGVVKSGVIIDWSSKHYYITTPESIRPRIAEALAPKVL